MRKNFANFVAYALKFSSFLKVVATAKRKIPKLQIFSLRFFVGRQANSSNYEGWISYLYIKGILNASHPSTICQVVIGKNILHETNMTTEDKTEGSMNENDSEQGSLGLSLVPCS